MINPYNLDKKIPLERMTSAMFGPKGAEYLRTGEGWPERRNIGLGWLLYAFTRVAEPELVVEAGAGGSSFCVLEALRDNGRGHLHTIDCWPYGQPGRKGYRQFPNGEFYTYEHNWFLDKIEECGYGDICTLQYGDSKEVAAAWDRPMDMLVIDSSHAEEDTKIEIEGYLPHLVPGGYAFFHDPIVCIHEIGYQLEQFVNAHDDYSMIIEPDFLSMAIIQRKFSLDCAEILLAGRLAQPDNPQAQTTPYQSTHMRALGALKPWKGAWIPERDECMSSHDEMRKLAEDIMESGREQTVEFVKETLEGK